MILKIEYNINESLIPVVDYEIYHPTTKKLLNLSICDNNMVNLSIPISIDENDLIKHDPKSDYYIDKCYPYTTDSGTDILLKDRYLEFNSNNMSLCENNCNMIDYDKNNQNVICQCELKTGEIAILEINYNENLYYDFSNKNISSSTNSISCFYTLFTKDGIYKNIGNYISIFFFIFFTASIILFYKCSYNLLEEKINEIRDKKYKNKNDNNILETKYINSKEQKSSKICKKKNEKKYKKIKKTIRKLDLSDNSNNKNMTSKLVLQNSKINIDNNIFKKEKPSDVNPIKDHKTNNYTNLNDYELNTLCYKDSIKYDQRTFLQIYISLIKRKHPIIFSFFPIKDYNSIIIKIDIFIIYFSLVYLFNSLFFDESVIHQIYEDEGKYNFEYIIKYILYSFVISHAVIIVIKYFSLSEKNLSEINLEQNLDKIYDIIDKIKKKLIIKYICFFILGILFFIFLWYYLSSFCAVYQNTQVYLIKNTLISFGFSLVYPFIINILIAWIRVKALNKSNNKCLYDFSRIIQYI